MPCGGDLMPINAGLMSSATPEWATPWDLFHKLADEFGPFDLDVCATPENAKVARFFNKADDGLKQEWKGDNPQTPVPQKRRDHSAALPLTTVGVGDDASGGLTTRRNERPSSTEAGVKQ